MKTGDIEWFIKVISHLPSDEPVASRTPGYNNYTTQKDHWLGWLNPESVTGTYSRKIGPDRDARYVYNHIMEPKMLLWLITAAGIRQEKIQAAEKAVVDASSMAGKSAAIRKIVPWPEVMAVLSQNGRA